MSKVILGTLMLLTGLVGLLATVCGILFIPWLGLGYFIGVIPGLWMLRKTSAMWKILTSTPQGQQAPQSQPDRKVNP